MAFHGHEADEEARLAARAVKDRQAFSELYNRYFSRVYNYLRFRCNDPNSADDLTSQVFERTLASLHRFDPALAPFGAWLFAIARNTLNDHLRAERRRRWLALDGLLRRPAHDDSPEERAIAGETRSLLLQALQGISERERDLLALKFAGGLTNRQIAGLTGLSESNVGVIVYRAVQRMRVKMESLSQLSPAQPGLPDEKDEPYERGAQAS